MKYALLSLCAIAILMIACKSEKSETTKETPALQPSEINTNTGSGVKQTKPTETFTGTMNGVKVVFKHNDYTQYRLKEGKKVTTGALNTERGFEKDEDATVYILNSDKPESEQKYFVRYTDGKFVMLDAKRKVVPGSDFKKKG